MARRKAQLGLSVTDGGALIPIGKNMFLAQGRTHAQGGIGLTFGKNYNPKGDLEIEKDELVQIVGGNNVKFNGNNKFTGGGQSASLRVFSSVPLLRGVSPAELVLQGYNPDDVFKAQEEFKDRNRINDDGTRYQTGGQKIYTPNESIQRQIQETGRITIGGAPTIGGLRTYGYLRGLSNVRKYGLNVNNLFTKSYNFLNRKLQNLINKNKISVNTAQKYNSAYREFVGETGQNIPKTISLMQDDDIKKAGGIYIKPSKRGTFTAAAKKRGMSVQEFASKVLANKEDYSPVMVKKANFARNASRWKKELGGDDTKTAVLKRLRNKFTVAGDYGGGMFGGAGAGSVIMEQPEYVNDTITKRYLVPVTQTFNDAFRNARNSGQNEFMFDGKLYNTNLGDNPNNNTAGASRTSTIIIPIEHKEIRRRKKEYGGNMIYTINGNVKNGLMSARPKAQYGKVDRKNKDVKVGPDGLIYKRAADGQWYTDGTKHIASKPIIKNSREDLILANDEAGYVWPDSDGTFLLIETIVPKQAKIINRKFDKPKRTYVSGYAYEDEEKETKQIGSLTYEKNEDGQWVPSSNQSITTTRSGGRPESFGMTRVGVNHPSGKYKYNPMTGERLTEDGAVETSEPSIKGTTKVNSGSGSTPRKGGIKSTSFKAVAKSTPNLQDTVNQITRDAIYRSNTPKIDLSKAKMPTFDVSQLGSKETKAAKAKLSTSLTGGQKEAPWIPQFNTISTGDWIGLGSNLAGHIASYFVNNALLKKAPMPIKPIMTQAAKLKTRYNINPELSETRETELVNRAATRRNTQSSNTSLAREQRIMNEARNVRNKLYGQKENIETQLINQDRLNRQSVMARNVAAYNDWLNKTYVAKSNQMLAKQQNLMGLISGIPAAVGNFLGNIDSRKATNNTIKAMATANPNVDGRIVGIGDYYSQKLADGRVAIYDKNGKLKKYV